MGGGGGGIDRVDAHAIIQIVTWLVLAPLSVYLGIKRRDLANDVEKRDVGDWFMENNYRVL